jgi:hypothetical protein
METCQTEDWIEPEDEGEFEYPVEYNISSNPNDFNVKTIFDFVSSGIVKIPGFQRNYVWDIKKASKLIESLIMGLPVPQVFFYERAKNDFLVIDGQQRLMTVFYFLRKRFPKTEKRVELRRIFDEQGTIPDKILSDDNYFDNFNMKLGARLVEKPNRLESLNYDTLDKIDRATLELRTIRCIVIKQYEPKDDSSMYEIFYRLNTGGVNLTPQEIRASLYYSKFYEMLSKINLDMRWRKLTRLEPDIRMRDLESLLRGFALLTSGSDYRPPMVRFLNNFSEESKKYSEEKIRYFEQLFDSFMNQCKDLPARALFGSKSGRFSISMYEAIFAAVCEEAYSKKSLDVKPVVAPKLDQLKNDAAFRGASQSQTTSKENVKLRLQRAKEILLS